MSGESNRGPAKSRRSTFVIPDDIDSRRFRRFSTLNPASYRPANDYMPVPSDPATVSEDHDWGHAPARSESFSSIDTSYLMDHRASQSYARGSNLARLGRGSSVSNAPGPSNNSVAHNSPSLVEKWVRRRSSLSKAPLLADLEAGLNEEGPYGSTGNDHGHRAVSPGQDFHLFSDDADSNVILDSKPGSRRSSNASSLDDVCFPVDADTEGSLAAGRGDVDLTVLTEFADEERKELAASSDLNLQETITEESTGRPDIPAIPGQLFNDTEVTDGSRLRPHRIVPWTERSKNASGSRNNYVRGAGINQSAPLFPEQMFELGAEDKANRYRFTFFRDDLDSTIHSPTISGLLQPGQTFADLFPPPTPYSATPEVVTTASGSNSLTATSSRPPISSHNSETFHTLAHHEEGSESPHHHTTGTSTPAARAAAAIAMSQAANNAVNDLANGPSGDKSDPSPFWLDVLNPTEEEMKVLSKAFGIHPLTTEDIYLGETREKVELFRNYYLVCFRSFDINDELAHNRAIAARPVGLSMFKEGRPRSLRSITSSKKRRRKAKRRGGELKPLNMYIIVFHEGVLTFHFAPTPHPLNVRRRARLLRDYITVSSDWISYALIDDITDGFAPMIEAIEEEVNWIEEAILKMHSGDNDSDDSDDDYSDNASGTGSTSSTSSRYKEWKEKGDMLRRIGECRKRVMSLLRLLGSKADVIKGFSKRCNEQWEVAPRSEIGLYLGDIQDHIVTMVQSLNHYEKLLARSHSNYLAQINIDMTRVNNDTNDVLGRITVLGTIVLPMNIVTGLWGMNVLVPGQDVNSLYWFWSITLGLFVFAFFCFYAARKIYRIA